ncbi:thioredoxin-like protein [Syncephalis pseudoplumigaleata]|uniref:Thioredoxin-like protein n=1 Tax=Syncephalis pseudoplumigaleata TaxID=1712513 RepID=A0A4V1J0S8_9FUNG|nr:thioredoxin-like protein [Syncephalis pseudoplumigaleata]RKP22609.1 thioredoxin-like protein [Syncephalis pseudoplumigaleata]|eukprot:RKP22316.1 thioredoxin-like protein [Syncephalis pseudoplumigaleata]
MSWRGPIAKHLRELRIHLCQTSPSSQGVRDYVKANYAAFKSANPALPVLVREATGIRPVIYARYQHGKEQQASVDGLNAAQVADKIKELAS